MHAATISFLGQAAGKEIKQLAPGGLIYMPHFPHMKHVPQTIDWALTLCRMSLHYQQSECIPLTPLLTQNIFAHKSRARGVSVSSATVSRYGSARHQKHIRTRHISRATKHSSAAGAVPSIVLTAAFTGGVFAHLASERTSDHIMVPF